MSIILLYGIRAAGRNLHFVIYTPLFSRWNSLIISHEKAPSGKMKRERKVREKAPHDRGIRKTSQERERTK
jgi:hypothetical protein